MRRVIFGATTLVASVAMILTTACREAPRSEAVAIEPAIYSTFYPTTYFCRRLVGDSIPVVCPVPDDADPIFWQPTTEALQEYRRARLIVVNGADFEKWVATASLPRSRVVDSAASFTSDFLRYETTTHSHGAGGEHTHEGIDGHTWLDPLLAAEQVKTIAKAVIAAFPAQADDVKKRLGVLLEDLDKLDNRLATVKTGNAMLLASHPAYNYLARRYGWKVTNFDFDPDTALNDAQIAKVKASMGATKTVMLWESEPLVATRAKLKEIGVVSVLYSPAEASPEDSEDDFMTIMRANLMRLLGALGS